MTDPERGVNQFTAAAEPATSLELRESGSGAKVLLLYASSGAGHRVACAAIEEALVDRGLAGTIKAVDILKYMPPIMASLFSRGYIFAATKVPWLWYAIYESKSNLHRFKPPTLAGSAFWKVVLRKLNKYLRDENPDYIISAYFTASWAAGRYKHVYNPRCKVATVITDYGLHPAWLSPGQDRYFVGSEDSLYELSDFTWYTSVPQEKIRFVGIPVQKRFIAPKNRSELREKHGLEPDRFTILILAGAYGPQHVESLVRSLLECRTRLQLVIVAQRELILRRNLKEKLVARGIPHLELGRTMFMPELMGMADIAISKTGGLTSTECLNSGCPLFVYMPYAGQEERNSALFLERGAAWRIFQLESLPHKVDKLAGDPQKYAAMVSAARELANPDAALEIADTVLEDLSASRQARSST